MNESGIKQVQVIVGALLYCTQVANNKILTALSAIGSQQADANK